MNITATLRNATRHDGRKTDAPWRPYDHLSGEIYGDTRGRFFDGDRVSTSAITAALADDVFVTRNSTYKVESWAGAAPANDDVPGVSEYELLQAAVEAFGHEPRSAASNARAVAAIAALEASPATPVQPPADRYPAPTKAELVTFWRKDGGVVMSVVANGAVTDYAIPTNVLAAGARYAIEKLEEMAA